MLKMLRKIIYTGTVTERWDAAPVPARFRGEVKVRAKGCVACGRCAEVCPVGAIVLTADSLAVDTKACVYCGRCVGECEAGAIAHSCNYRMATLGAKYDEELGEKLRHKIRRILGRSLAIRHVDVGSCNACDWEMVALGSPVYDIQQYGIDFVASPRHADMLMVTGIVTRNLTQALLMTYEATPAPKLVMAVGSCAASGKTFGDTYAIRGAVDSLVPVDIYVPGCPPRPAALLHGLLLALDRLK